MCFRPDKSGSTPLFRFSKNTKTELQSEFYLYIFRLTLFFLFDIVFDILLLIEYELWKIYLMYRPD